MADCSSPLPVAAARRLGTTNPSSARACPHGSNLVSVLWIAIAGRQRAIIIISTRVTLPVQSVFIITFPTRFFNTGIYVA